MKIEAVIFDLDGVIVSTDECHYRAWKKTADEEGIYFDRKINDRLRGVSRMDSLEIVLERAERLYTDEEKVELAERKNNYYKEYIKKLTKDDILNGVNENLAELKAKGIKVAIGLDNYFDAVSDGNNITKSKPDPEVFLKAADMLGVPYEKCLVVEDADSGIEAGKRAGMYTLAVNNAKGADYSLADLSAGKITDYIN